MTARSVHQGFHRSEECPALFHLNEHGFNQGDTLGWFHPNAITPEGLPMISSAKTNELHMYINISLPVIFSSL